MELAALFDDIKTYVELSEDGYINHIECLNLIHKKMEKYEKQPSIIMKKVKDTTRSQQLDWYDMVDVNESFDFVDQESVVPYSDDKDDFDLWKERNKIDEDKKFNRYIYKGNVYWMEAGSQGELELIQKICQEKFTPSQIVEHPSQQPLVQRYLEGGWGTVDPRNPRWWEQTPVGHGGILSSPSVTSTSCISVDLLKGTIQSSENNE